MSGTSDSRKPPEGFTAHLIRLVQACGDTLKKHAAEIVGTKSGTMGLQITINIPQIMDGFPDIIVKQTYVSDEAMKVIREDFISAPDDAGNNAPDEAGNNPTDETGNNVPWVPTLKDCSCTIPTTQPEMEASDDD